MEGNFNSGFLDWELGDQKKQQQKQCVGITQGKEILGKVAGANNMPCGRLWKPPQPAER